ncbi:hypothetical protein BDZ94DRAFT_1272377 [Collybia nuda]|uniref:Uncharacterized protein n=1 Tax=Collybia nuda TaxID=64659 RepID=A0A9P6CEA4_9AGAR|nr:hypothetical protein BDZ94DRAFT_1272377 [Collybia nuda]
MLPYPFPQQSITTPPTVPPFSLGVIEFFVFTLGTSLLDTLLHYALPPSIPTTLSEPPPDTNSYFEPGPPTSTVMTEPPYVGTMTIGGRENEGSRKYIFRGMVDVIEENAGQSYEPEEQTFALSIDLTSGYVDMDEAHSLLDTILRDWLGSRLDRLEKLEILLPPNFKREKTESEPFTPSLPKLIHFTWKGNAADMPLPFTHLSYLPLKQLTHINLQTALSVTDVILILHNCFEIEQAEFHGLSDVPSVLNLRTRPLRVLRFLNTLKLSSSISLRPLFEEFEMRFLHSLSVTLTTNEPEDINFGKNIAWNVMRVLKLHGNFSDDTIQKVTDKALKTEVDFSYSI